MNQSKNTNGCYKALCHACNGSGYDCFDDRRCDVCSGAGDVEVCREDDWDL